MRLLAQARRWQLLRLGAALAAAAVMLCLPPVRHAEPKPLPTIAQAWPAAQRGTIPAGLADGTAYEPGIFLDARTSIGSAPSPDGKQLRLLIRRADGTVRELRRLPLAQNPSFETFAAGEGVLVWSEHTPAGQRLWRADLPSGQSVRLLTGDTGDMRFYRSQYDLVIAAGRVHWVAATPADDTEVRSVALAGGPVEARTEPGTWALTTWPWLVDGLADVSGAGRLRNLLTGRDRAMPLTRLSATTCTPAWCQVVSLDDDGRRQMEVVRPDGSDRRRFAGGTATTAINDVAILDRFAVFAQIVGSSQLTGRLQLLVYDISTRRTIEISPAAGDIWYAGGVLWWSTGSQEAFLRHTVDLRTV